MLVARGSEAPQSLELLRDSKLLPIRPMAGMLVFEAPPLAVCRIVSVETITLRRRGTLARSSGMRVFTITLWVEAVVFSGALFFSLGTRRGR